MTSEQQQLFRQTAASFRLGREAEAAVLFRQCIDWLQQQLQQQPSTDAMALLPEMLAAQQRQDWLGLADTLEYELLPIFIVQDTSAKADNGR